MFRSIRKYTPLLRRGFVCVLILLFLMTCVVKPVPVNAAVVLGDPMTSAIISVLFASGFFSDSAELLASATNDIIDAIDDGVYGGLEFIGTISAFTNLRSMLVKSSGETAFSLDENQRLLISKIILYLYNSNPGFQAKLKHDTVDFSAEGLSAAEVPLVQAGVRMYVPDSTAMQNVLSITQLQILSEGFYEGFERFYVDMIYHLNVINNNLMTRLQTLREYINDMSDYLGWRIDNVAEVLKNTRYELNTAINDFREQFGSRINYIAQIMQNTRDELIDNIVKLKNVVNLRVTDVKDAVIALPDSIYNVFKDRFDSLQQTLDQILEKFPVHEEIEIVQKPQIEVQVGQQQILVSDYASMGQAFSAKMAWVPQIFDFLAELRSRLNSGTAPKVAIDLSDAEGSYNYGGRVYVLDMSWYARYKPSVDTFLSGVMWICFGWALYKRIPDILSGVGLTVENATETRGHVWADRAEREASLSYRQERRSDYYAKKNNKGG